MRCRSRETSAWNSWFSGWRGWPSVCVSGLAASTFASTLCSPLAIDRSDGPDIAIPCRGCKSWLGLASLCPTEPRARGMAGQLPIELVDALLRAVPEAGLIVGSDFRLIAANPAMASLLPSLRPGEPLVRGLRTPDILDAIARAFAARKPQKVQWRERVPVERLFDVYIAPVEIAGLPHMVMLTLRDLSEIRRVER